MKEKSSVSLTSCDDIFGTDISRAEAKPEKVERLPLSELKPFKNHPFKILDDTEMQKIAESISQNGIVVPLIARPVPDGGYEIISGHRRVHAAELLGLKEAPVIVREMNDDEATVLMVDSNLQRENILPSERAFAYKMKLEAMKHQGERTDLKGDPTSRQVGEKLKTSVETMSNEIGESERQIQRYIRLTELVPELLDMVDQKKISFNPAVELSYLTGDEQLGFIEAMDLAQSSPSLSQAQRLKKLSAKGMCTFEAMCAVMDEDKKGDAGKVVLTGERIGKYFPKSFTPKQMEDQIIKLLEQWQRKRSRECER